MNVIIAKAIWFDINWYDIININFIISKRTSVDEVYPDFNLFGSTPNS